MRTLISIFAVVALLLMVSVPARAADSTQLQDEKYTIVNNTANAIGTLIPTTMIIPQGTAHASRVLSVKIMSIQQAKGGTENIVAIYDASTVANGLDKQCEGEIERTDGNTQEIAWTRGLKIYNGCVIRQGAWTVVNVEYETIPQP